MDTHRIKVKLGDAEFDAEGAPETVNAQFTAFLAALSSAPPAHNPLTPPAIGRIEITDTPLPLKVAAQEREIMDRVFRESDVLSLAALPRGDSAAADAMLALLYGYLKLKNEQTVTGTMLMKSAKVSGVQLVRVDRIMNGLTDYVLSAGVKKGRRYQLNNRGLARAEEIVGSILN